MTRHGSCGCGQLALVCEGDPIHVSMCHCLACQQRTGSLFCVVARFSKDAVRIEGESSEWVRVADSGNRATFHFCPRCGSTVFWRAESQPDLILISVGAFADPAFPPPQRSVYEGRKHAWVCTPADAEHWD